LLRKIGVEDPTDAQLKAALSEVTSEAVSNVAPYLEAETLPTLCSLSGGNAEGEDGEDPLERLPEAGDTAEAAEARMTEAVVEREVRKLPPLYKAAFRGRVERSMPDGELAVLLGRSRPGVENLVRKACLLLRRRISRADCPLTPTFVGENVNRSVNVDLGLDPATWEALGRLARQQKTTRSEAFRRLLER
jgi:hypothetical protein